MSTISRKSSKSRSRSSWLLVAALLAAAIVVYAWIDGGYREVRLIEKPLDPPTAEVGAEASE